MEDVKIQSMNKKELASLYGVGRQTFSKWLLPFISEIGEYRGRVYTPKQVAIIFKLLGKP